MAGQPTLVRPDDHADRAPDSIAVVVPTTGQRISYRTMVDRSKQLANVFRSHGLRPGDHVAIFMTNVPEYFEGVWAARRGGYVYTAVNSHLTPREVRYMLENFAAKALIVSADLADVAEQAVRDLPRLGLRLVIGPHRPGWDSYAEAAAQAETTPTGPELGGQAMLYSSGTTGRPKGIIQADAPILLGTFNQLMAAAAGRMADGAIGHGLFTRTWWEDVIRPAMAKGPGHPRGQAAIAICGTTADGRAALARRDDSLPRDVAYLAPPSFMVSERRGQRYARASLALLEGAA